MRILLHSICPCRLSSVHCFAQVQEDFSGQMCPSFLYLVLLLAVPDKTGDGQCGLFYKHLRGNSGGLL